MFNRGRIESTFGVKLALDATMAGLQTQWRNIARGHGEWNNASVPSLNLPNAISLRVARKVCNGLNSEVTGSERAEYLQENYEKFLSALQQVVLTACNHGELILKPYMKTDSLAVTLSETDCYWPVTYNEDDVLIDVVFAASIQRDDFTYNLLERHLYNDEESTHKITYRAFMLRGVDQESLGNEIPLTDVPEWAHLQDVTIHDIEKPLFVHFKLPLNTAAITSARFGVPIWHDAIDMIRKADLQESYTDWEYEGGQLAIDASVDMFKPTGTSKGRPEPKLQLPQGKERLYRTLNVQAENFQMQVFNPDFRIMGLNMRMNDIKRLIEFQCGLSYGQISDAGGQDRTAEEFKASKDNFFSTVTNIQQTLQVALDNLIYSFDTLADLQGITQGGYEVSYTWDDSIMADRQREFEERIKAQTAGWLDRVENRAWYLGVDEDSDEALKIQAEIDKLQDEYGEGGMFA